MWDVLIVDDEPGALKSLKYAIDWESEGFRIAAEASDGEEALEFMKRGSYTLIFSDIRMPGMDGLELMQELRAYPYTLTIAVSGYDEFEYVKQCLKYGVKDYLLKPVKEEDLIALLHKLKSDIEINALKEKQRHLGTQMARRDVVKQWAYGRMPFSEAQHMLRWFNINIPDEGDGWTAIAVEMDSLDLDDPYWTDLEWQTATFAVRNVLEELARPIGGVFDDQEGRFGLLIHNNDPAHTITLARGFRDEVMRYTKIPVTLGIGMAVDIQEVPASFRIAQSMLEHRFLLGAQAVIAPSAFHMERDVMNDADRRFVTDMLDAMKHGQLVIAGERLRDHVDMWKHRGASKEIIQAVVMEWMVALYDYARQFGEQGECFFRQQATPHYSSILESRTLNQLSKLVQQTCEEWTAFLSTRKWTQPSNPVAAVRQIVEKHYAEPLSLKSLAERLHINAAYLGQLFKATEGITFNDYLLQLRMNKARDMLAHTDMKVYEIAMSVGYKELDWFYKKFKETYGLSASEYRLQFK